MRHGMEAGRPSAGRSPRRTLASMGPSLHPPPPAQAAGSRPHAHGPSYRQHHLTVFPLTCVDFCGHPQNVTQCKVWG